jgi:CubicO group peptidase (beta-lactamase class C family)
MISMIAAGGIITNADDMAKYLQFHLNLGRSGDSQVIPEVR